MKVRLDLILHQLHTNNTGHTHTHSDINILAFRSEPTQRNVVPFILDQRRVAVAVKVYFDDEMAHEIESTTSHYIEHRQVIQIKAHTRTLCLSRVNTAFVPYM